MSFGAYPNAGSLQEYEATPHYEKVGKCPQLTLTHFSSVQFSCLVVSDSATPWTAACQASLSITNS